MTPLAEQIARAKELLATHGFQMAVSACSCCDGAWIRLTHDGEPIIFDPENPNDEVGNAGFDMFEAGQ
ncbi:hypothetical protein [Brevundimonas sp. NIBR10]|uniref:hypothetical protein n=1 Tax=Brevundimonas sp. NIBR10 TaxID=3015997 RepID=UPI0022F1AC6B|nr:hypothetical protein [Brevundimonas sp. NIBR10]